MIRPDTTRPLAARLPACGLLGSGLLIALLAGCAGEQDQSPQSLSDKQLVASCRQQVGQAYREQNRAQLSEQNQLYTPFSSSGTRGITTTGLATQYVAQRQLSDCLRQQGAPAGTINTRLGTGTPAAASPGGSGNAAVQQP